MGDFGLIRSIRFREWWFSKIPPLVAIYFLSAQPLIDAISFFSSLSQLLFWALAAASFGYYLNDYSDISEDRAAGKPNSAASDRPVIRLAKLLTLAGLSMLPWIVQFNSTCLLLSIIQLLVFVLYSVPPIRLKERGWSGLFADSCYAHLIPAFIALSAVQSHTNWINDPLILGGLTCWMLFFGLRNVLGHQLNDLENDRKSGMRSVPMRIGEEQSQKIIIAFLLPIEVCGLLIVFLAFPQSQAFLILAFLAYQLYKWFLNRVVWQSKYQVSAITGLSNSHLNNFYEQILPLFALGLFIYSRNDHFWLLLPYFVVFPALPVALKHEFKGIYRYFFSR